jgi:hypothetical protein
MIFQLQILEGYQPDRIPCKAQQPTNLIACVSRASFANVNARMPPYVRSTCRQPRFRFNRLPGKLPTPAT